MQLNAITSKAVAFIALASFAVAPVTVNAQSSKHRQETKNTWRNLAIGSGVVGLLGLLKGDKFLTIAGAAGALYSADRYEKDRKSQRKEDRARYEMFRRGSYTSNGHRYVKKLVKKNGHTYYQFVRAS